MKFATWLFTVAAITGTALTSLNAEPPDVMLAHKYRSGISVADYFVSEKLDGVRARWTGSKLVSRGGNTFSAPQWFIADFPTTPLDGELWSRRGEYQTIASVTARQQPHEGWRTLRFMVFDMPAHDGDFAERVAAMRLLPDAPFLTVVDQQKPKDNFALQHLMSKVIAGGGEGLMLHRAEALYQSGRSRDLLKLKRFDDAEAIVIGYRAGNGKYTGLTGALQLQADGKNFYVGSGLSDAERRNPPPLGSLVSYRYQGYTDSGLPRFAVYLRQRAERDNPD